MDNELALLTLCGSIIALLFVASRAQKVLRFPEEDLGIDPSRGNGVLKTPV